MTIPVISEAQLRDCMTLDKALVDSMRTAFSALADGTAVMPPVLRLDIHDHNGEMDVKTAYLKDVEGFCLKVSTGFFNNPQKGLPSLNGMMTLFSSETGQVMAVLLDNGYLTDIRTAAAGGLSVELLSCPDATQFGVIGTGLQAKLQIEAAALVRNITHLRVWGRNRKKAEAYAQEMATKLDAEIIICDSAEDVVRESDAVITTTPATAPVVQADWLHAGLHITAMGSDAEHKNELHPEVLAKADLFVADSKSQSAKLGELHHALESGAVGKDFAVVELGQLTNGSHKGRSSATQITICDLSGTGAQDTVIALAAYRRITAQR